MNPDEFDALIRAGDPAANQTSSTTDDPFVGDCHRQWARLVARRRIVRKRVSLCLAAIGLFAVVGGTSLWVTQNIDRHGHAVAEVASSNAAPNNSVPNRRHIEAIQNADLDSTVIASGHPHRKSNDARSADLPTKVAEASPRPGSSDPIDGNVQGHRIGSADRIEPVPSQLDEFATFVEQAGKRDSESWRESRDFLARQTAATQRAAINLVPQLTEPTRRDAAMDLVCDAAGDSERSILKIWLNDQLVAPAAWQRLIEGASFGQSIELIEFAKTENQRTQVCQRIAASTDSRSIDVLLRLTNDPKWRISVGRSAANLHPDQIQLLIMLMRQRSIPMRTAVAFMLASVPGDDVDRVLSSMILRGRYRQPAYLVLLSRDTPQARAFLAQAASTPELTPALVSARMHFANIQQQLSRWISESKGASHEPTDTILRLIPEIIDFDRCDGFSLIGTEVV
ncbi:MAG: hypothetical protein KDB00_18120 [Planctomycetales bacterium]|nr:hypothetical protein [Planctomycetales bacterium]